MNFFAWLFLLVADIFRELQFILLKVTLSLIVTDMVLKEMVLD
jgi:hypothetical protein